MQHGIWLLKDAAEIFSLTYSPRYNASRRFDNKFGKLQGQFRDVVGLLPEHLRRRRFLTMGWLPTTVNDPSLSTQDTHVHLSSSAMPHARSAPTSQHGIKTILALLFMASPQAHSRQKKVGCRSRTALVIALTTALGPIPSGPSQFFTRTGETHSTTRLTHALPSEAKKYLPCVSFLITT